MKKASKFTKGGKHFKLGVRWDGVNRCTIKVGGSSEGILVGISVG